MKNKEKEKFWLQNIKEKSKNDQWKFREWFIYKKAGELFFYCSFFINPQANEINAWLGYKTLNIDNIFWDIIEEKANKEMPLSFRGRAAFCVNELKIAEYKVKVEEELNPDKEINEMLEFVKTTFQEKVATIKSLDDYKSEMLKDEKSNTVGIITALIEQKKFEEAITKVSEYKVKNYTSGFGFEEGDFYDIALKYCKKNYR